MALVPFSVPTGVQASRRLGPDASAKAKAKENH